MVAKKAANSGQKEASRASLPKLQKSASAPGRRHLEPRCPFERHAPRGSALWWDSGTNDFENICYALLEDLETPKYIFDFSYFEDVLFPSWVDFFRVKDGFAFNAFGSCKSENRTILCPASMYGSTDMVYAYFAVGPAEAQPWHALAQATEALHVLGEEPLWPMEDLKTLSANASAMKDFVRLNLLASSDVRRSSASLQAPPGIVQMAHLLRWATPMRRLVDPASGLWFAWSDDPRNASSRSLAMNCGGYRWADVREMCRKYLQRASSFLNDETWIFGSYAKEGLRGENMTATCPNSQSLPRLLGAQREPPREPAKPEAPEASEVVEASTSRELRRELLEVLSNPNIRSIATKYYQAQLPKKSRLGFRDLRQVLKALNEHLGLPLPTAAAAEQLFKRYDFNGDGDLSFEEFFELFVTSLRRAAFDRSVLLGREIFVTQEPGKVWEIYHRVKTLGEGSFGQSLREASPALHRRERLGKTSAVHENPDRVVKTVEKSKAKLPIEDIEKEIMVLRQLASSPEHFQPVAAMADRKAVIKNADMAEDMQQDAIDCATQALEKRLPQLMSTFCSEVQPHLALCGGAKLRLLRHPRDEAFHLFLPGAGGDPPLQVWLRRSKGPWDGMAQSSQRQRSSAEQVDHPHIIRLHEWYEGSSKIYLVMDAIKGGTLRDALLGFQSRGEAVEESWSRQVLQQMLQAMAYCHNKRIIHKDLKDENVMLLKGESAEPFVVIIDLGVSEMFSPTDPHGKLIGGTPMTMAPEVWDNNFGSKCDVWSAGGRSP
eukprot:g10990.t1